MTRKWSGILVVEGTQTGDSRFILEGAIEWSDLPLPLGYQDETMHSHSADAVTIGTIDTIERVGQNIQATGQIDEDIPQGAELVRRMDTGTAPHGSDAYVSIDPDNWDMELVSTVPPDDSEEVIIVAAGEGRFVNWRTAAAGDGDPSQEPDAEVLYEDAAGDYVERYTRLRIRGATVVPIPAFDGAIISLESASAGEPTAEPAAEPADSVAASAFPARPPAEWFEEPKELADEWTPYITVTEDGRVFGYIAPWDSCHIGFPEVCTTAPSSPSGYAYFRTGSVLPCDEDCAPIPTGPITIGTGHAPTKGISAMEAAAHYDNTGSAIADVACGENVHGVWMAGALRPDASEAQIRVLRASTISGDWRSIGGSLELVAALGVNTPGFMGTRTLVASGKQTVLIGAGTDRAAKVLDPAEARWRAIESRLLAVERVTGPLKSHAMRELVASLRKA